MLKDSARSGFSVTEVSLSSQEFTFNYSGAVPYDADTAPNEYISAMLTGGYPPRILYYGRIAQPLSSSGTLTIDFSGIPISDMYGLLIISEQYNGDKKTRLRQNMW